MAETPHANSESWPARQQSVVDDWDDKLWDQTEMNHPRVVWWWNQKQMQNGWGAFCYVCDQPIATWNRLWPMTQTAKDLVMAHRLEEIQQLGKEG